MKAIEIDRVSTEEQKEAGNSLQAQSARIQEYCRRKDFTIIKKFSFDESAYKDTRVIFDEVIGFVKKQKERIAICFDKVDRLSRDVFDKRVSELYRMALNDQIELHFVSEGQVINSKISAVEKFQFSISLGLAKYYSDAISDNVKRSREQILRDGRLPGKAPFGYINAKKNEDTNWVFPDPVRAHIVKEMYELYATGAHSMLTLKDKMNKAYGTKISKGHIDMILKKKFYHGIIESQGKEYPHVYETLISEALYNKVQEVKAGYNKKHFKFAGLSYAYRGLIRCNDCGCVITPEKKKGLYVYYHCTQHKYKHQAEWLREEEITKQFAQAFKSIQVPDHILEKLTETLKETHERKQRYFDDIQQKLTKEYTAYETKKDNLLDLKISGRITDDIYDKKFKELQSSQDQIKNKINNLHYADKDYFITASYLLSLANRAHELFMRSEIEQKRQIIKLVFQNLELSGRSVRYKYAKPFDQIFSYADRQAWLPDVDSNHEPTD